MEDPSRYFSTPPVNEILALHAATEIVLEEGLEARFARHRRIARAVRAGLDALGLATFTDGSYRADTLTVACLPDSLDDGVFRGEMVRRKVVVAAALGPIAGKAIRIGHMGNIGQGEVVRLLHALEGSLAALGRPIEAGTAVAAAAPHLT
jgi:aspartate aminotransferase-like enzyme